MMRIPSNVQRHINRGQPGASNNLLGAFKGIVEDVLDPFHLGRVRVRVYSVDGDYKDTKTEHLPWAEPCFPLRGNYSVPEIFDRVWVIYENGNRLRPVWMGYHFGIPTGLGKLPHNRKYGTEVPREVAYYERDHYPQSSSIFRTGEGDQLIVEDSEAGQSFVNRIVLVDTSGKSLKFETRRQGAKDYRPEGGNVHEGGYTPETVYRKDTISREEIYDKGSVSLASKTSQVKIDTSDEEVSSTLLSNQSESNESIVKLQDGNRLTVRAGSRQSVSFSHRVVNNSMIVQAPSAVVLASPTYQLPEPW